MFATNTMQSSDQVVHLQCRRSKPMIWSLVKTIQYLKDGDVPEDADS